MFQLREEKFKVLMSQIATSNDGTATSGRGGRRKLPLVFTEHGALQAASVLNSSRALEVSLYVVRAFVQSRGLLAANEQLAQQLVELDKRLSQKLSTHDQAIAGILNTLRALMQPPESPVKRRPIGFVVPDEER